MKNFSKLLLLLFAVLLYSCDKFSGDSGEIQYFPFQSEKDGRWGMMSPDGEVLFEGEFKECPTVAMNDRFMVKNADGLWEIYTAEDKPKQVGGQYKSISVFREDVTAAVEKNKPVTLIDRDGKVVKELDKLNGKAVASVGQFSEGLAPYQTVEGMYGMIDTEGNVAIDAKYLAIAPCSDGKIMGVDKKYKDAEKEKSKICVMDKNGKLISELSLAKFEDVDAKFVDGVCIAEIETNGEDTQGLIDEKGEWVVRPTSKTKRIREVMDDKFIFGDGDSYGVMDFKGETIIRAKYDGLYFAADDLLMAYDESADESERYSLIDSKGEAVGKEKFAEMFPFIGKGKKHALVKVSDNDYGIIDRKGELLKLDKVDIYSFDLSFGDGEMESDFVDINAFVEAIGITANGIDGASISMTPEQAVRFAAGKDASISTDPENYTYKSVIGYEREIKPSEINVEFGFNGNIGKAITKSEYYYGYYLGETITGYSFSSENMLTLTASVKLRGKFEDKGRDLFQALSKKCLSLGKRIKGNTNSLVVGLGTDKYAVVALTSDVVIFGVCRGDGSAFNISGFENLDSSDSSFDSSYAVDSMAVDSAVTIADSTAY